jgi:hypothetical protein
VPTSEHKAKRLEKFERMRRAKSMPKMDAEEEVRKKKKQTYRQIDRQKKRNLD